MGLRSKTVTIASALAGLAIFSQAPEFAQQYRQRIGGAVEELRAVVVDFDEDAGNSQLSREQALDRMIKSTEHLTRDRGRSMTWTIGRFERLNRQQNRLENSHPLTRPLLILKNPDGLLLDNAWEAFEPALPINSPGLLYGGLGALLTLLAARMGVGSVRRMGQRRSDKHLTKAIESPSMSEVSEKDGTVAGDVALPDGNTLHPSNDGEPDARQLTGRMAQSASHARTQT
ncbi:MAG: DUF2937 family protein [Hyphomicrobiales bacterium]|nr:DUF2937 family protein [Hyphomicrobiales bacterium]